MRREQDRTRHDPRRGHVRQTGGGLRGLRALDDAWEQSFSLDFDWRKHPGEGASRWDGPGGSEPTFSQ